MSLLAGVCASCGKEIELVDFRSRELGIDYRSHVGCVMVPMICNSWVMEALAEIRESDIFYFIEEWEFGNDVDNDELARTVLREVFHNYRHKDQYNEQLRTVV